MDGEFPCLNIDSFRSLMVVVMNDITINTRLILSFLLSCDRGMLPGCRSIKKRQLQNLEMSKST